MTPSNISHYLQTSNSRKHNYRTRQTGSLKYEVIGTNIKGLLPAFPISQDHS